MSSQSVTTTRPEKPTAATLVRQYRDSFQSVLPSHIKPETWVRVAQSAVKKGKRLPNGAYQLEVAALNNPAAFLGALMDAARLGLEPGTEEFYLTPRKVKGREEILGIVGYQGLVELIYRAGAVSSVIAEVVHERDHFTYRPGRDPIPVHDIDWDADDRGPLRLVYAYARMKDGAHSRVVVMNRTDIARVKASSAGANLEDSPWNKHPEAMWLKSAVRQLSKWVPTSSEYLREQLRALRDVAAEQPLPGGRSERTIEDVIDVEMTEHGAVDTYTGEVLDGEVIEDDPDPERDPS